MTRTLSRDPEAGRQSGQPRGDSRDARLAAVTAMVASSVCFAVMAASAKAAREHVDGPVVVLVRSIILAGVLFVWMRSRGLPIRSRRPLLLHLRGFFGTLGLHLYFYALGHAPLGEVVVLANTAPLYTPILGLALLGERPRALLFALLLAGFAGVAAIAWPGAVTLPPGAGEASGWGILAAAGTGLTTGVALVCVKRLTESEHPLTIVLSFAVWCLISSLPAILWIDLRSVVAAAGPLLLTSLSAMVGQVLITWAMSRAPMGVLVVFVYVGVVLSFVIGFALWDEEPSGTTVLGALLIVIVCIVATRFSRALVR